jgi:polyhydroxybutyrate depolymerase
MAHQIRRRPRMVAVAAVVMTVLGSLLVVPAVASAAGPHPRLAPSSGDYQAYTFHLTFGHRSRSYRLHVPPAARTGTPLPLVLNLAGDTQNGFLQEVQSQMDPSADAHGYLVAYPNGTRISVVLTPDPIAKQAQYGWDAGLCCGLPVTKKVNDVGFLLKVISDIAARTPVNLRRVYVTGMSSGGMMSYAMAAEASRHIAAIASVSGQVEIPTIHPTRAVPTMEFHSVDDPIVSFTGSPNKNPKLVLSVQEGLNQWVKADGCSTKAHVGKTIVGAAGTMSAGQTATLVTYTHCRSGAEVALWRFTGSGHVWPGSAINTGGAVGPGMDLVNADQTMWQFFKRFSLPTAPPPTT